MRYDWLRLVMVLVPLEVGFSANSPKKQCGKSLDRLGNLVPDCLVSSGWSAMGGAASIDIAINYLIQ